MDPAFFTSSPLVIYRTISRQDGDETTELTPLEKHDAIRMLLNGLPYIGLGGVMLLHPPRPETGTQYEQFIREALMLMKPETLGQDLLLIKPKSGFRAGPVVREFVIVLNLIVKTSYEHYKYSVTVALKKDINRFLRHLNNTHQLGLTDDSINEQIERIYDGLSQAAALVPEPDTPVTKRKLWVDRLKPPFSDNLEGALLAASSPVLFINEYYSDIIQANGGWIAQSDVRMNDSSLFFAMNRYLANHPDEPLPFGYPKRTELVEARFREKLGDEAVDAVRRSREVQRRFRAATKDGEGERSR